MQWVNTPLLYSICITLVLLERMLRGKPYCKVNVYFFNRDQKKWYRVVLNHFYGWTVVRGPISNPFDLKVFRSPKLFICTLNLRSIFQQYFECSTSSVYALELNQSFHIDPSLVHVVRLSLKSHYKLPPAPSRFKNIDNTIVLSDVGPVSNRLPRTLHYDRSWNTKLF